MRVSNRRDSEQVGLVLALKSYQPVRIGSFPQRLLVGEALWAGFKEMKARDDEIRSL